MTTAFFDDRHESALGRAGATAWRLLGIGALVVATWWLVRHLMPVLLPLVIAVLLATLLRPLAQRMERRGVPGAAGATAAMFVLIGALTLAAVVIVPPVVDRIGDLGRNVEEGARQIVYTVAGDVAGVSRGEADRLVDRLLSSLSGGDVAGNVLAGATALAQAVGGIVLILFLSFFLIKDAPKVGSWLVGLLPADRRTGAREIGERAWGALGTYIRGVIFVATVDALFIGAALVLLGVDLALPLIVLTWFAAFFPILGAIAAGAACVLVALVTEGTAAALILGGVIVAVQQLEGNVLYPVVVGPRLRLHPLAVLLAVTIGGTVGGIAGAFLAVPVATVIGAVLHHEREAAQEPRRRLRRRGSGQNRADPVAGAGAARP